MLAVSTFQGPENERNRVQPKEIREGETDGVGYDEFPCLLPVGLELDDFFLSIDDADLLPDLEMDPEMLAEFHVSQDLEMNGDYESSRRTVVEEDIMLKESQGKIAGIATGFRDFDGSSSSSSSSGNLGGERKAKNSSNNKNSKGGGDGGKTAQSKGASGNQQGKRKVKVDWTPDLHRRFVQAVEQLGMDKAVPSRILELMGIDSLTRHNIASHLQKYRSHRKHLLAREAEAASWSQRKQSPYGGAAMGMGCMRESMNPWVGVAAPVAPLAFPTPTPAPATIQPFRPLHVWGHPTVDVWPKHVVRSPPPWAMPPATLQTDPKFWNQRFAPVCKDGWAQGAPTAPGTAFYPQRLQPRFPAPPVPGIPLQPDHAGTPQDSQLQLELLPSKETIDDAIGDVLTKPWQPLPLGLKPPSLEGVLSELQRQGISKLPPAVGS